MRVAKRKQFLLRIDPEIWREIDRWAADEFRSVNGQIEFLLKRAVDLRRRQSGRPMGDGTLSEGPDATSSEAAEPAAASPDAGGDRPARGRGG